MLFGLGRFALPHNSQTQNSRRHRALETLINSSVKKLCKKKFTHDTTRYENVCVPDSKKVIKLTKKKKKPRPADIIHTEKETEENVCTQNVGCYLLRVRSYATVVVRISK